MKKLLVIAGLAGLFLIIKLSGFDQYLSFDYIKANQEIFQNFYDENKILTIGLYLLVYIVSTALSLPGAAILTLLGGALFGLLVGTVLVSFASTIGATLAFLISRFLLQKSIQEKYADKLKTINDGIKKEGAFYLFSLRLIPIFPFFLINLVMGLTPIKTITFFFVSQVGMLLGTIVYVNAGVQLSELESARGILSVELLLSFALLGIFPLIAKRIIYTIKAKKVYKAFKKPKSFDYNMVVIGAGSAGLVTSYICAAVKAKVALIEKEKMGGDCLNTGCVPSKAIIKSAKIAYQAKNSALYGVNIEASNINIDFKKAMGRVQDVITKIEPHDSIERYTELGVECLKGDAQILGPWEVKVGEKVLTTKNITIASGASPFVPPIKGIEKIDYLTSNNLWKLESLPEKFVILGGGPIGLEMAQSFSRLGSKVIVVEMAPRILGIEDEDVSNLLSKRLIKEGIELKTKHKAVEFILKDGKQFLICDYNGDKIEVEFDKVLVAVGRKANIEGFGLSELGVSVRENGTIEANEFLETNFPNIFVCGDVTGPYQLTHTAAHQAWFCAVNGLFGKFKKFRVDYSVIPWCTYTDPEVATVGRSEQALIKEGVEYDITKYDLSDLDRAICDSTDLGFVKVMTAKGSDKILGATIIGEGASNMLLEFITCMKHGKGLNSILSTIHTYPTLGEANKFAAGVWKKNNAPEKLLRIVAKFHRWSRG